jgi:hypothetical protein
VKPDDKSWEKLVAAARRAPAEADASAPFGFATRVAALAFEQRQAPASNFARMTLRAAAVAGVLAAVAVAVNFSAIKSAFDDDSAGAANDDPVAEVVDMGS